jgi:hypothetical protein
MVSGMFQTHNGVVSVTLQPFTLLTRPRQLLWHWYSVIL